MTSSDTPHANGSAGPPNDEYHTPRFNVVAVIVLAMVSVAAAIGTAVAIKGGADETRFPAGYFGDVARLSQRAADDLAALAPPADARAACLKDDTGETCDAYAFAASEVGERLAVLSREFAALRPPSVARAWHREYRQALDGIRLAFRDQARAIAARRLDAFEAAAARGDAAVAREIALSEQFNADFAAQLTGAQRSSTATSSTDRRASSGS